MSPQSENTGAPGEIRTVLFDLGGVVVKFQPGDYFSNMLGMPGAPAAPALWDACPWVTAYESGNCDRQTFARGVIDHFSLEMDDETFLAQFCRWPDGLFPGIQEFIGGLSAKYRIGCLSNTSELHWQSQREAPALWDLFGDLAFLSFELGHMKPGAEIYNLVAEKLACSPAQILFFDDKPANIETARSLGWNAHCVQGPAEAETIVVDLGLMP